MGREVVELKHEGENPTGDGDTVGITVAKLLEMNAVAFQYVRPMASYAAISGIGLIFIPEGKMPSRF